MKSDNNLRKDLVVNDQSKDVEFSEAHKTEEINAIISSFKGALIISPDFSEAQKTEEINAIISSSKDEPITCPDPSEAQKTEEINVIISSSKDEPITCPDLSEAQKTEEINVIISSSEDVPITCPDLSEAQKTEEINVIISSSEDVPITCPEGGRAARILFAACVIIPVVSVYSLVLELHVVPSLEETEKEDLKENGTNPDITNIRVVYIYTYCLSGLSTGILIAVLNYRVAAVLGATLNLLALSFGIFVTNYKVLTILLGFCLGMGNNLLVQCSEIALLTHFQRRRLLAVTLTVIFASSGSALASYCILYWSDTREPKPQRVLLYPWASYILCLAGAATLIPVREGPEDLGSSIREQMNRVKEVLSTNSFWLLASVFFCFKYDTQFYELAFAFYEGYTGKFFGAITTSLFLCSCCCHYLLKECTAGARALNRTGPSLILTRTFILMAGVQLVLAAVELSETLKILAHCVMGFLVGISEPLLIVMMPVALGDLHIPVPVALIDIILGVATLASYIISEEVEGSRDDYLPSPRSYIHMALFLLAAFLAFLLYMVGRSKRLQHGPKLPDRNANKLRQKRRKAENLSIKMSSRNEAVEVGVTSADSRTLDVRQTDTKHNGEENSPTDTAVLQISEDAVKQNCIYTPLPESVVNHVSQDVEVHKDSTTANSPDFMPATLRDTRKISITLLNKSQ